MENEGIGKRILNWVLFYIKYLMLTISIFIILYIIGLFLGVLFHNNSLSLIPFDLIENSFIYFYLSWTTYLFLIPIILGICIEFIKRKIISNNNPKSNYKIYLPIYLILLIIGLIIVYLTKFELLTGLSKSTGIIMIFIGTVASLLFYIFYEYVDKKLNK